MLSSIPLKKLAACSLAGLLFAVGQGVYAHTTVRDQATEGTTGYNALQIGHGCTDPATSKKFPVTANVAILPTVNPIVTRLDPADPSKTVPVNLFDVIDQAKNPLGLAGLADLVQDRSVFAQQDEIYDDKGNLIGFYGAKGNLQTNLRGLVTFRFTPPAFVPADATHCAKRLLVKIAIADVCNKKTFPPKPGTANLWIPSLTAKFTDGEIDGIGAPATLTINHKGALDPACGDGYDVTVTPSAEDVDAHLPFGWGR
jgi:hypothetical protein